MHSLYRLTRREIRGLVCSHVPLTCGGETYCSEPLLRRAQGFYAWEMEKGSRGVGVYVIIYTGAEAAV